MSKNIIIVDYGMGNLWSVESALHYLGIKPKITGNSDDLLSASHIILPGVGSYFKAMTRLNESGLTNAIRTAVLDKKITILGICLGMQLLAEKGSEDGQISGLGIIKGSIEKFDTQSEVYKLPHIGFNQVDCKNSSILYNNITLPSDFYFVHSYRLKSSESNAIYGTTRYAEEFISSFEYNNVFGTQFHPEKSQTNGLHLLKNFIDVKTNA